MAALNISYTDRPHPTFSALPVEVTVQVLQYLFNGTQVSVDTVFLKKRGINLARASNITSILRVNRRCCTEAKPIFYDRATFHMRTAFCIHPASVRSVQGMPEIYPMTTEIRNLVITPSPLNTRAPLLNRLFPRLRNVWINLYGRTVRQLRCSSPTFGKVHLAERVLEMYDDMCRRQLNKFKTKPFGLMPMKICWESYHQWIYDFLMTRIQNGEVGIDQSKIRLKIDLTDTIPWITGKQTLTARTLGRTGRRLIGIYNPDAQIWMFSINGKQITVPERMEENYDDDDDDDDGEWGASSDTRMPLL